MVVHGKIAHKTRRLRVAIYAPHFAEYSYRLAAALAKHCDVRLVLNRKDANQQWNLDWIPAPSPFDTRIRDLSLRRSGAIGLPRSFLDILTFRPDVVHCHECPEYFTAGLMELLKLSSLPRILTVHDAIPLPKAAPAQTPAKSACASECAPVPRMSRCTDKAALPISPVPRRITAAR